MQQISKWGVECLVNWIKVYAKLKNCDLYNASISERAVNSIELTGYLMHRRIENKRNKIT